MENKVKGLTQCLKTLGFSMAALMLPATAMADSPIQIDAPKPQLAMTPPMGWNSWNKFGCAITEAKVRGIADAMASSGMKAAGYEYVIIDDCWQKNRDEKGNIIADPVAFPSGIKALSDYIHAKGLKFGIYSDAGILTCGGRPGGRGYEFQDARQYAEWGVDYLKYDWCHTGSDDAENTYRIMATALRKSGRDILFSLCEWGRSKPHLWAADVGHMWRTTGDIGDIWDGKKGYEIGVVNILDQQVDLWPYAGPNHWNDPDMLEVGNHALTVTEAESHFSLWAILAAPLIAGNDLEHMNPDTLRILTNHDVIAVDQDAFGQQGRRVRKDGNLEVWSRPLEGGDRAVVLFNRSNEAENIRVDWTELDYPSGLKADVMDLWSKQIRTGLKSSYQAKVEGHGVVMVRISPQP